MDIVSKVKKENPKLSFKQVLINLFLIMIQVVIHLRKDIHIFLIQVIPLIQIIK